MPGSNAFWPGFTTQHLSRIMPTSRLTLVQNNGALGEFATLVVLAQWAGAQPAPLHYFHAADLPPGTVGYGQLQRYLPLRGYIQPVEVNVPPGARVSVNVAGAFTEPSADAVLAGMQVGSVYQLKISNIPYHEGFEVFPTIEVINRLYPPEGKSRRFPIPIEFTQEELEYALSGRYVTRVVYLEDQASALPIADEPRRQRYFEAPSGDDPLRVADELGRPMLIMRMGSRVRDANDPALAALLAAPPAIVYPPETPPIAAGSSPDQAIERPGYDVPRVEAPRIGFPVQIPFAAPTQP